MAEERDLGAMAREIIDANLFMTLATADSDGRPWATPVYFTPVEHREFLWISEPDARHSRNIAARRAVGIVIFDSTVRPGSARAAYIEAEAVELTEDPEIDRYLDLYNARFTDPHEHGLRTISGEGVRAPAAHRLYRATASAHFVLDPDGHPDGHAGDYRAPAEI
jgi:hypothetical protein